MANAKSIVGKVAFGLAAAVLVAIPAVATPVYLQNETAIKGFLLTNTVSVSGEEKTASKESGDALAKQALADGTVLLKNEGKCLPLDAANDTKINVLGYHSVAWLHGGSGSGMVSKNPDDEGFADILTSLRNYKGAEIELNEDILAYYRSLHNAGENPDIDTLNFNRDTKPHAFDLYDPAISGDYQTKLNEAVDFSDVAIVVIGRQGGESEDMPEVQYKSGNRVDENRHDLQISEEEEALLRFAGENFKKTIVVINSTNLFQMDFLESIPGIDAAMYIGPSGTQGADIIAKMLFGDEVAPSGHLADILPYDFTQNVAYEYAGYEGVSFFSNTTDYGNNQSTNAGVSKRPSLPYVDYVEGLYVGYRYYETADRMNAFASASRDLLDGTKASGYDAVVQFPFGYGQSYTDFSWEIGEISVPEGSALTAESKITFQVVVKNIGESIGKDVVQLYLDQPYTSGGIEKSATKLVDFAKTSLLAPGDTEVVTLSAKARDLASYDCYDKNGNGKTTYEIDPGDYMFRFATDSHHNKEMVNSAKATRTYKVNETILMDKDAYTGATIDNLFTGEKAIDGRAVDGLDVDGWDIPYISRANMPSGPVHQTSTHDKSTGRAMDQTMIDNALFAGSNGLDATAFNAWNSATVDEFGETIEIDDFDWGANYETGTLFNSDGTLTDLGEDLALNADDESYWSDVLTQMTYESALSFVNQAHPNTKGIAALNYPATVSLDGPAQCGSFRRAGSDTGVGFPCAAVLAQTWNKDLLFEVGLEMGTQMTMHGIYGIYGCGMNIHRTPFGGRNYEYYSEDPFLTGAMAVNYAKGVKQTGNLAILKHFVLAETETSRDSLYTYLSEQALREIYLEPFRMAVEGEGLCAGAAEYAEEGRRYEPVCNGIMTAYNRIGSVWAGGSCALMKGVLAKEWGFIGEIITDYSDFNQYMNLDQTMRYGGGLGMAVSLRFNWREGRAKIALRDAIKGVIYANLRAKLAKARYDEHPYAGKKSSSAVVTQPFDWVTPAIVALNVVCYLGAASVIYFGILGHPGLKFGKRKAEKAE
ncbi:MAG: glycoside hydrolase family 3 C-terminal domain-containing protein [Bacilli bacterium]|nr:glycoside hydrolase family 3 C-terminal domain-containing protein [Bacilli bacterium]